MASQRFQHNLMDIQSNMLNFAYMLTSNRDDAHDLLQSTTLKALVNEDKYIEGADFKGWVFTIMRNTFINDFARSASKTPDSHYKLNLTRDIHEEIPEGCISEKDFTAALNLLDNESRAAISMHITGYSLSEIADCIGTTIGSIRTCIRKASRELISRINFL